MSVLFGAGNATLMRDRGNVDGNLRGAGFGALKSLLYDGVCLFVSPCLATLATIKRVVMEVPNGLWVCCVFQLGVAWVVTFS